jgi:hypothetical protein
LANNLKKKERIKMADSILSITVRDTEHPCAPYQTTGHTFYVQIFHCDGKPLFWKGANYGRPFPLDVPGEKGGRIHAQVKVPPGTYLVRAIATCKNVVTDWAWVNVGCDQTVCVNLVPPSVLQCINRTLIGLHLGTVDPPKAGEERLAEIMPEEVKEATAVLRRIADKLPKDPRLPAPPTVDEIRRAVASEKE